MMKTTCALLLMLTVLLCGIPVFADEAAPADEAVQETTEKADPEFIEGSTFTGKTAYDESLSGFAYEADGSGGCIITGYNGTEQRISVPMTIGDMTVTAIGDTAFYAGTLISVELPASVVSIGEDAFGDSKELMYVSMPSVKQIGAFAFKGCDMLREAEISGELEVIGDSAFEGCVRLGSLKMPSTLTHIGTDAFIGCENMILDCSESTIAAEYAERFSIPTSFAQTGTFQLILCAGIAAVLLAAIVIILRLVKK